MLINVLEIKEILFEKVTVRVNLSMVARM